MMACILVQACNNFDPKHTFDVPVASDTLQTEIILPKKYMALAVSLPMVLILR